MKPDSATTVAFSGHRSYRPDAANTAGLDAAVSALAEQGYRTFLCGMACGFDLAAAEAVLRLRASGIPLTLHAAVPFPGQADSYRTADRARYERVLASADVVQVLSPHYYPSCFLRRNDFLVASSALLVCWWDGSRSGTGYTVRQARACGLHVINLYRC